MSSLPINLQKDGEADCNVNQVMQSNLTLVTFSRNLQLEICASRVRSKVLFKLLPYDKSVEPCP